MQKEYKIDPELQKVMPELREEEKEELEKSLLKDGFKGAPIVVWGDIIIDGHNRYQICKENGIPFKVQELEFENKTEVIQWMIRAQLGRRNLNDAQRIKLVEEFRPILERQAKERQGARNSKTNLPPKLGEDKKINRHANEVTSQIAKLAGTGKENVRKAEKVLKSSREEIKDDMLSGKLSINAAHKELQRLEREGRAIENPESVNVSAMPNTEGINEGENNKSSDSKLKEVKQRCTGAITILQRDIDWMVNKEFFDSDGDELTSKTRSELRTCIGKLKELANVLEIMKPDDCGDENVIILNETRTMTKNSAR